MCHQSERNSYVAVKHNYLEKEENLPTTVICYNVAKRPP
jgi:hypothetical protein